MSNHNGHVVVANVPAFLHAARQEVRGGFLLTVHRSLIVDESYQPFREVMALTEDRCHKVVAGATVANPNMMWGKAIRTAYAVHEVCPGADVAHTCARLSERKVS